MTNEMGCFTIHPTYQNLNLIRHRIICWFWYEYKKNPKTLKNKRELRNECKDIVEKMSKKDYKNPFRFNRP
jgi:hypothetical protein